MKTRVPGLASVTLLAFAMTAVCTAQATEDTTAYQIDTAHSGGIAFEAGFTAPLVKKWKVDTGHTVSFPLIVGGQLFVISNGNTVFSYTLSTGKRKWQHLLGGFYSGMAYDNGNLYFAGSGKITSLRATNGKQNWSVTADASGGAASIIAVDGSVYVGGEGVSSYQEDKGTFNWENVTEGTQSSVAFGDGAIFGGGPTQYYAFNPDGSVRWHPGGCCDGGGGIDVAYFNKGAYIVDGDFDTVLASKDGSTLGSFPGSNPPSFFTVGKKGFELTIDRDGHLVCSKANTGNVSWTRSDISFDGRPIAINGQPVAWSGSTIYMLDGKKGHTLWSVDIGSQISNLSAGDGVLAVTSGSQVITYVPQ